MTRGTYGGGASPVRVVTEAELASGRFRLSGRIATPVYGLPATTMEINSGRPTAVYVVTQEQIDSGEYGLAGGGAEPVLMSTVLDLGRGTPPSLATPIYIVGGADGLTPAPEPGPLALLLDGGGYWALDEASGVRYDSHGTKHLSADNDPLFEQGAAGFSTPHTNTAWSDWKRLVLSPAQAPNIAGSFTMMAWVRPTTFTGVGSFAFALGRGGLTFDMSYTMYITNSNARMTAGIGRGTSTPTPTTSAATPANTATLNTWNLLLGWYDNSIQKMSAQLNNGTAVVSASVVPYHNNASLPMSIGGGTANHPGIFVNQSQIKRVAFFHGLLTADERTWLYNSGDGRSYAEIFAYQG